MNLVSLPRSDIRQDHSSKVTSVSESMDLDAALELMMDSCVVGLPVVGHVGKLAGDSRVFGIFRAAHSFYEDKQRADRISGARN